MNQPDRPILDYATPSRATETRVRRAFRQANALGTATVGVIVAAGGTAFALSLESSELYVVGVVAALLLGCGMVVLAFHGPGHR